MTENKSKNILEMLEQHVISLPDRQAVIYEPGERITYRELWMLSGRIYAWLKVKGIGAEDVVMFCLPRGIGLYACIVGTLRAGAAFVLTETDNSPVRTAYIRKDSECRLFVDEKCMEEIMQTEPLGGYEPVELHNLCYIAYTSGTTGNPKGVLHEYGSLENAWKSLRWNGIPLIGEQDTFLAMSPMNFVSLPIIFAAACAFGNTVALMPYAYSKTDESFGNYLEEAGVNCGYLTPSFLQKHYPFRHPWRMCIMSSEPADGLYIQDMKCYNCYASTESGCLLTVFELPYAMTPAPVGKSQSDIEVFVMDEDEMELLPGEVGEICYRNPYVRGYLNLPERTRNLLRGRIFHPGDAGCMTEDGDLIVCGRVDEMFKISGYRIEPEEIAAAVRKVSDISHLVVRGFVYKDVAAINVFYTDDIEVDTAQMRERLLTLLPEYMVPTGFIRLKNFPLLETGKLDKLNLLPSEGSWDAFRKVSSSTLPILGKGKTATIYALGEDKALKVYRPSIPFLTIRQEQVLTEAAHDMGLPVPNAYEIVHVGAGYGVMMDKIEGEPVENILRDQPERRDDVIRCFAEAVRKLHAVTVKDDRLPDIREVSINLTGYLDEAFCTKEEAVKIRAVFEAVPKADTFVHGDCHPGNAIAGEMTFIDLMLCGRGDPVFDLLCMYSHYVFLPSFVTDEKYRKENGMDKREAEALFDSFLRAYRPDLPEAEIAEWKEQIKGVHAARICLAPVVMPGIFPTEVLKAAKDRAVRFSEKIM